jgi:hypothetical protein
LRGRHRPYATYFAHMQREIYECACYTRMYLAISAVQNWVEGGTHESANSELHPGPRSFLALLWETDRFVRGHDNYCLHWSLGQDYRKLELKFVSSLPLATLIRANTKRCKWNKICNCFRTKEFKLQLYIINLELFPFVGRQLDGIWHTAIVAYGREYFFGPAGIHSIRPVSISSPLMILFDSSVWWEFRWLFSNTIHIATMWNTKRICEVLLVTQVVPIATYSILRPSAFFLLREYFYAVEKHRVETCRLSDPGQYQQ